MNNGGIKYKETFRILKRNGWEHVSTNGSHAKFKNDGKTIVVMVNSRGTNSIVWGRIVKKNNLQLDC